MNLPICPNYRDQVCERSQIRLLGENDASYLFTCATCNLFWAVSKPKTRDKGAWEARMSRIQKATEEEARRAGRRAYSWR